VFAVSYQAAKPDADMSAPRTKNTVQTPPHGDPRHREVATPRVITDGAQLREVVLAARQAGQTIGLVPTMGALHEGHLSLVDRARSECDVTVVTVFVNPTQFGPGEDFHRYPRDLFADLAMLGRRGCNLVFAPNPDAMYPPGYSTTVDVGPMGQALEGEHRPTHFRGVATIVLKLFQLAPANRAYFGRKDYQQTLVVRRMVEDLNVPIEIRVCPIIREPDGLAMSSRNAYLSSDERRRARSLSQALRIAEASVARGERSVAAIRRDMEEEINSTGGIELQYIAFLADGTVTPVEKITGPTTIALAALVGKTRLIDNTVVSH
jgi:pantoate--beta-alanine ligase